MQSTNKKLLDLKNMPQNKGTKLKSTNQKMELNNKKGNEQGLQPMQKMFSRPYEAQDKYAQLLHQFEKGDYDIGYQTLQKAFPFQRRLKNIWEERRDNVEDMDDEIEMGLEVRVNDDMKLMWRDDMFEERGVEEGCMIEYEESEQSEEESTKENSSDLTNRRQS